MNDRITIIEGPTPTFEPVRAAWVESLVETPSRYHVMMTCLRTMNGKALIERCHRTWADNDMMYLHFRNPLGLEARVPIIAAQLLDTEDGQQLILWLRMNDEELSQGYVVSGEDDDDDNEDED